MRHLGEWVARRAGTDVMWLAIRGIRPVSVARFNALFPKPIRASMKRIIKQPPQCMSFTLRFPGLGKAFNYCKMIGSHATWWNDLALSGDFIPFHRVENNARRVSPWWNYFLLSPLRFMQKVQFYWHDAIINVHDILVKTPTETGLRASLIIQSTCWL